MLAATAARRVTQATDQQTYANEVATAKEQWLKDTVAAQEAADVRLEQDYAVRRAAFAEETAARLLAQAPVYRTYEQAVQTAEQDYQLTVIEMTQNDSVRLDQLDAALLTKITHLADIDLAWMSGGLAAAPAVGAPRPSPSGGALPGAAAIIHAYADSTAADEKQEAYEVAAIQKTYEKTEHQKAKNRELADHASLKAYDDKLAAAVKQRYVDEGTALANWQEQSAGHISSVTTTAYGSLGTPYAQHVIALAAADALLATQEKPFIIAYYTALGTEQETALKHISAERQTRSDAISGFRLVHRDAVSDADEKLAKDLADNAHGYTTGIAPAREQYRDALGQKRREGRVAGIQAAVDNNLTFWHGGNYGLPPQPAKAPPTPSKAPAVAQPKPQEQIDYGIEEADKLGDWAVADANAARTQLDTSETAYVTYVTQSGEERRLLAHKIADEQKQLSIAVATETKNYLNAAASRVVTALTTFVTAHPSAWANDALSKAQAAATELGAKSTATLTDATNQANAAHAEALTKANEGKQRSIDKAANARQAALDATDAAIVELTNEWDEQRALALKGLYDIVDLPWEPRPGVDLPEAPFTLPDDIIDYAPRFVDTWFASVGTPEAVMVLSLAGTGAGSRGLPYSLIGSGAMFVRSTDDGGSGGIGPNGTNRTAARTSAWRKSGDGISSGIFSFASDAAASGTSNETAPVPQTGEEHALGAINNDVTGIDSHGSGTSPDPDEVMAQSEASRREYQIGGVTFVEADPATLMRGRLVLPAPPPPVSTELVSQEDWHAIILRQIEHDDAWKVMSQLGMTAEEFFARRVASHERHLFYVGELWKYISRLRDPAVASTLAYYVDAHKDSTREIFTLYYLLIGSGQPYTLRVSTGAATDDSAPIIFSRWRIDHESHTITLKLSPDRFRGHLSTQYALLCQEYLAQILDDLLHDEFGTIADLPETDWMRFKHVAAGMGSVVGGAGLVFAAGVFTLGTGGLGGIAALPLAGFGWAQIAEGLTSLDAGPRGRGYNPLVALIEAEERWFGLAPGSSGGPQAIRATELALDTVGLLDLGVWASVDDMADLARAQTRSAARPRAGLVIDHSRGGAAPRVFQPNSIPVPEGHVRVYRAVSEAEYQDIVASGRLRQGPNSLEGKWFAGSLEGAHAHATGGGRTRGLFPDGQYRVIEVDIPTNARSFHQHPNLDGHGPAFYLHNDDLGTLIPRPLE